MSLSAGDPGGNGAPGGAGGSGGGEGAPRVEATTHRGIRWQRAPSGRMRWWDDERATWVRYRPGDDAPPRPPGWETSPAPPPPLTRPRWRSPYRLVPIAFAVLVVVAGLIQALRSNVPATTEAQQAHALLGKCLRSTGQTKGIPTYSDRPVACNSPDAAVKVMAVVSSGPGSPGCPPGTAAVQLLAGVSRPHLECVAPERR